MANQFGKQGLHAVTLRSERLVLGTTSATRI
jgi:hypothetical protein